MAEQMKDPQGAFLEIYDAHIKRQGSAELRAYLLRSDFFRAPASTRYHCAYEGGLCEHSVNVYRRLCATCSRNTERNGKTSFRTKP